MPVKNLAVDPITAGKDGSIKELAERMDEEQLGDIIIVEDEKPIGIVTDRDIALAVARNDDISSLTAADIMTEDPVVIHGDARGFELPETLAEAKVRRLPVVDQDGTLTGIVTLDDLVATIGEEMKDVATVIEAQSPGFAPEK